MWENLSVHYDIVESDDALPTNDWEIAIQDNMNAVFLWNEKTAKLSYALSANEMKDAFQITLKNLRGMSHVIDIDGSHDAVTEVNRYIVEKAVSPDSQTTIDSRAMMLYSSTEIALLQERINNSLSALK